ncbi:MAG TPA: UDP-glucose/GDP-mannose dehydrogenase family protein [Nocardioidaceae bacterium]|jgi:UDPglucose 6-dehydrogenase|nr:UDP-glucose/GDP-mannose dehydrogenase family protein [Nocardioidaceae bacterium]
MKLSVIGAGYLGAVHAACMVHLGHDVVAIEANQERVEALQSGQAPIYEPGLDAILSSGLQSGRLLFTSDYAAAASAAVHFICVGTPQLPGANAADTTHVFSAVQALAAHLRTPALVVGKSTVPVGTARRVKQLLHAHAPAGEDVGVAWNPEFLREGFAVEDTLRPDRLVYGVDGDRSQGNVDQLDEVYGAALSTGTPRIVTDLATAELVKVAANAFLATKISFINAMAEVCEVAGGDVVTLADAIGYDARIGRRFLNAGVGFGGGCLPKDIRAFMARAGELGAMEALTFLREVDTINLRRRARTVDLAREECGGSVEGRRVAVLGAAFKPNSDDIRDSPALDVARSLHMEGAEVVVHDPKALHVARFHYPELKYEEFVEAALRQADIVLHLTEWDEYRQLDPAQVRELVATPTIIDGRNALSSEDWASAGWTYRALGRAAH